VRYERRKIAELRPDPENPRTIKPAAKAALGASLRRFGQVDAVVFNERTGRLVGGHQRLDLLLEQGETEADVAIGSWNESDERALNVALNNPASAGSFTDDVSDFLGPALTGLGLEDFQELRLDAVLRKPKPEAIAIETAELHDEFWISVRGPIAGQLDALEALKKHLLEVPGVTVEIGAIKR
jgi:hypothetical protein